MRQALKGLVPLLLATFVLVQAYLLSLGSLAEPGPGLWPFLVGCVLTASSVMVLIRDRRAEDFEGFTRRSLFVVYGIISLVGFVLLFNLVGFVLPGFLVLAFWLRAFAGRSWGSVFGIAAGCVCTVYVLFVILLGVPFPEDLLASAVGL